MSGIIMNPRSTLHALTPFGVGTAQVESLISYFCRVAVSHSVSVLSLSREIAKRHLNTRDERLEWHHRNLSGMGQAPSVRLVGTSAAVVRL